MIVPGMSVEKKMEELKSDYWEIYPKLHMTCDSYTREVVKIYRSPLLRGRPVAPRRLQIKTRNNNEWTIILFVKCGAIANLCYVTLRSTQNSYITLFTNNKNRYVAREFTPHFVQRYRDRLLVPSGLNLTGGAIIENYMMRTSNAVEYEDDDGTSYSVTTHGFVASQYLSPQYVLMKTYIAKDETFSKNKAEFSERLSSLLNFFLFISENHFKLTYELIEEQLHKCELFNEDFLKAFAEKFRPGSHIKYEDFEAFRRQQFGQE